MPYTYTYTADWYDVDGWDTLTYYGADGYGRRNITTSKPKLPEPIKHVLSGNRVKTPDGAGSVWSNEDDIICVVLDDEPDVLHEYSMEEVERIDQMVRIDGVGAIR